MKSPAFAYLTLWSTSTPVRGAAVGRYGVGARLIAAGEEFGYVCEAGNAVFGTGEVADEEENREGEQN